MPSPPVARGPIAPTLPEAGWQIAPPYAGQTVQLTDRSLMAKVLIRGDAALEVPFGLTGAGPGDSLVIGTAPGEWLLFALPGSAADVIGLVAQPGAGLTTLLDVTHGYAVVELRGVDSAELLARLCRIDLADDVTPDGSALRSLVGGLVVGIVRSDRDGERSYLLYVDRSYGQSFVDMLLDVGAEFGLSR